MRSLISYFKTPIIEFLCDERYYEVAPPPIPAGQKMPEWFKRTPTHTKTTRTIYDKKSMTVKKCMPVLDAMTLGFIIPLAIDQQIVSDAAGNIIKVGSTSTEFDKAIEFHSIEQVGGKSDIFSTSPMKFINPWVIKTAPGWSTLFTPCLNYFEDRFICLSAVVDTDKYPKQVNFPGKWLKSNYDDYLPAGTPLVTVIPIKRPNIITAYDVRQLSKKELHDIDIIRRCQNSRDGYYTNELRAKR